MTDVQPTIAEAIREFVEPRVAARMLTLIESGTPKSHRKLVLMLPHFTALKPSRALRLAGSDDLAAVLRDHGDPQRFEILSDSSQLDDRVIDASELVARANDGPGILAVADPRHLAVFCGEDANSVHLLT
ncbi:hypothetical protein GCM10025867_45040 [Frondihabitans sucicola]|uniref:Uncharacterized protein n=1 Tax=Frondihabitans sucicola TaxID=1268041 RepID=A0ABN6Y8G5_9MICO|nr:hypothetical protein [Frondihabitans sucicola]BDZ47790.1 hypothetical protein GCM10025867_00310 [Frondihabitans sucicola]BDZ52263.1 hypothetical protein GCM10025867_45040 [Frondihabitans sucicola]